MRVPVLMPVLMAATLAGLAACSPPVPDSAAGVGFGDYNSYLRQGNTAPVAGQMMNDPNAPMTGPATAPAGSGFSPEAAAAAIDRATGVSGGTTGGVPSYGAGLDPNQPQFGTASPYGTAGSSDPNAGLRPYGAAGSGDPNAGLTPYAAPAPQPSYAAPATGGTLDPNRPRGDAPMNIQTESGEMVHNNSGISDEQDFKAVSGRETIESDKERLARNRAQYTVIQPTAVPQRSGDTGPNIVEYALKTTNNPGTQVYARSSLRLTDPQVACARYGSSDLAQQAFLAAGGPERDRKGLDPDGDGFACDWDPRPFRN